MGDTIFEHKLTPEEIEIFDRIQSMEDVHNALGEVLSAYRESILTFRNDFVKKLQVKYKIERPALVQFDPTTKSIVSVFHPNQKAHIIVNKQDAFRNVAFKHVQGAIKDLTDMRQTERKQRNG